VSVPELLERMEAARHEHLAQQEVLKGELLHQAKALTQAEEAARHWQEQFEALKAGNHQEQQESFAGTPP
jgi:hypothetical protein